MAVGEAPTTLPPEEQPSLAQLDATPTLARQTMTYAVSGMIAPALAVVTLPVFARVFSPSEYGVLELGTTMTVLVLTLTDIGLVAAAQRSFYDYSTNDATARRRVLWTALTTTTIVAAVVTVVVVALRGSLSSWLFGSRSDATVIALIAASILPLNTVRFLSETMRLRFQAKQYLVTTVVAAVLTSGLAVGAVLVLDVGVEAVFAATAIGGAAASAYGIFVVRDTLAGGFSREELRTMLAYGLPLIAGTTSAWALALVDRIILNDLRSLDDVGQYAIANRLAALITLGMTAFLLAAGPFLFSVYSENASLEKAVRARMLTYLTFILSLGALAITLFARELIDVLAPRFSQAYEAVGPLAFGAVGYGIAALLTTGVALARRTGYLAALSLFSAALNIGLNFALIPPFGFVGSAFATTAGYGLLATSYYWAGQRVYPTPYEPRKVALTLALAGALAVFGVVPLGPQPVALAVKLASLVAFVVAIRVTGVMTPPEFAELRKFVVGMIPFGARPSPIRR
jgi:O-antigen/teichoic acid export membrane protein